ncbi:hypothetical protein [Candidatus Magnetaquicoccus inordinatus]|uniref:hypothetical protein n=1 Tax=Candidatus Magnetaquicoccus inordinatus TaxID=2496818 RepID=UPI00187D664F|nr:hypothetical protein [Candidatus Magnetaquicoccus inordinatus]
MAEPVKTGRSDAQMHKAKLKLEQIAAQSQSKRMKHLMERPKPRVKTPVSE